MEWKLERQLLGGIYSSSTGDCNNNFGNGIILCHVQSTLEIQAHNNRGSRTISIILIFVEDEVEDPVFCEFKPSEVTLENDVISTLLADVYSWKIS